MAREVALWQVDEASRVCLARWISLVALPARLLIKLDVVVLLKRALPVEELRRRTAMVGSTAFLYVPVPALSQHAHVVINPVTELASIVEGNDG